MNFIYYQINLILFIFLPISISGQSLEQQVIPAQGNYAESPEMSLSWTIGESIIDTKQEQGQIITQGFQQPWVEVEELVNTISEVSSYPASLFPNPTADFLNLKVGEVEDFYLLEVFDINGKLLHTSKRKDLLSQYDLQDVIPGQYLFKISNPKLNRVSLFKIIKH